MTVQSAGQPTLEHAPTQNKKYPLDFSDLMHPATEQGVFSLPGHHVWCGTIGRMIDGRYFMIYSQWPFELGFEAWVSHSNLGLAISDSIIGPFRHVKMLWEFEMASPAVRHNPLLVEWEGKWFLYFMGNSGPLTQQFFDSRIDEKTPGWWEHRNNQRVWLATADDPLGEWTVSATPVFQPEPGYLMTSTPCCFVRPDEKVQAVIKTVRQGPTPRGGRVEHHTFLAPHPSGPFTKISDVLLQSTTTAFPVDDHFEFHHEGAYYAVVKDHGEGLTAHGVSLLLLKSNDGLLWDLAPKPLVTRFQLCWENGECQNYERLEMPRVLFQNGRPSALNLSAYPGGEQKAFNIRISLDKHPSGMAVA